MVRALRWMAPAFRSERPRPKNWFGAMVITAVLAPYGAPFSWAYVLASIQEPMAVFLPLGLGGRSAFFGVVLISLLATPFALFRSRPSRLLAIPVGGAIGFSAPYVDQATTVAIETLSRFVHDSGASILMWPDQIAPDGEFFSLLVFNGTIAGLSAGPLFVTVLWHDASRIRC